MSETIKAICIFGNEVNVNLGVESNIQGVNIEFAEGLRATQYGLCEKPMRCHLRKICTGDVEIILASSLALFSSIIQATFTVPIDLEREIMYKPSHAELYAKSLEKMIELKNKRS